MHRKPAENRIGTKFILSLLQVRSFGMRGKAIIYALGFQNLNCEKIIEFILLSTFE